MDLKGELLKNLEIILIKKICKKYVLFFYNIISIYLEQKEN